MSWYDRAEIYDILCGWDPSDERDFVVGAAEEFGLGPPRRILEPFCGSGRLLRVMPGRAVGLDRNPSMVRYARSRGCRVFRADASRFAVREGGFDLAFCLIDSFRHVPTEEEARAHLRCVARALLPGGVYVIGFDVTGDIGGDVSNDAWTCERDGVQVSGDVRCLGDRANRIETMQVRIEVRRGARCERIEDFQPMRVYSRADVRSMLDAEGSFEIAAVFDRHYDLRRPIALKDVGSAVFVLRKRGPRSPP